MWKRVDEAQDKDGEDRGVLYHILYPQSCLDLDYTGIDQSPQRLMGISWGEGMKVP